MSVNIALIITVAAIGVSVRNTLVTITALSTLTTRVKKRYQTLIFFK